MYRLIRRSVAVQCSHGICAQRFLCFGLPGSCSTYSQNIQSPVQTLRFNRRFQSSTEKKFHCSVCKKSFRLEMAAKLHLQQAHGGDGTVEAGAGPGMEIAVAAATVNTAASAPPSSPVERSHFEEEERRPRRMRPTPKPLHHPDREVPEAAMNELLGVWDKVGLNRLEGKFIHSTMVMKVFAARPDATDQPLYESVAPEGDNPFEAVSRTPADALPTESCLVEPLITGVDLDGPFAAAPERTLNPFRAGRVENPFVTVSRTQHEILKSVKQQQEQQQQQQQQQQQPKEEQLTAPVTPFGQLPLFGKEQGNTQPSVRAAVERPPNTSEVASPFAAAVADSPFAGTLSSLFTSQKETDTSSPGVAEASPFTAESPFLSMEQSPFASSGTPSPFTVPGASSPSATFPMDVVPGFPNEVTQQKDQCMQASSHECPTCGKTFSSFEGAAMHSRAKHGINLENEKKNTKKKNTHTVPDLPAYIPSPVDLSSTTPFGTKTAVDSSWSETDVVPHAQSISNITLVGRVLDITHKQDNISQVTVFVQGEKAGDEETVTLHCSAGINDEVRSTVKRNAMIFVSGTLRLHHVYEASNNKYYASPVVHVALPIGTLAVIA